MMEQEEEKKEEVEEEEEIEKENVLEDLEDSFFSSGIYGGDIIWRRIIWNNKLI